MESLSPIPPKKNRLKVLFWLLVMEKWPMTAKKIALEVKTGDKVLFGKYAGTEIQIDGEEHLIMREDDIIAIIE